VRDVLEDLPLDALERGPIRLPFDDQTHEHATVAEP
jgi:hypothetical protein